MHFPHLYNIKVHNKVDFDSTSRIKISESSKPIFHYCIEGFQPEHFQNQGFFPMKLA